MALVESEVIPKMRNPSGVYTGEVLNKGARVLDLNCVAI
jgi:hypothetical protein